jgi:hypothetical protein
VLHVMIDIDKGSVGMTLSHVENESIISLLVDTSTNTFGYIFTSSYTDQIHFGWSTRTRSRKMPLGVSMFRNRIVNHM